MAVLDAFAIIAFLCDEPAAREVEELFAEPTYVAAPNIAEVLDQFVRVLGCDQDEVLVQTSMLQVFGLQVVPMDELLAHRAGLLRARHYERRDRPVSLADCAAAATALTLGVPLATADEPLTHIVRAEGGRVIALPDSTGMRP